jgi:hypothetical protein
MDWLNQLRTSYDAHLDVSVSAARHKVLQVRVATDAGDRPIMVPTAAAAAAAGGTKQSSSMLRCSCSGRHTLACVQVYHVAAAASAAQQQHTVHDVATQQLRQQQRSMQQNQRQNVSNT